jgi:glutamyl-tRNA reductase
VAFAAVRLAEQVFADLSRIQVLLVGAGETIELVARHLAERGVTRLTVANRTLQNAQALAERHRGTAATLADLALHLSGADLVISSTAAREPVISARMVAQALAHKRRPLLLIDLAVPRDIEPATAELDDVFLYTVDDLGAVIAENLRSRQEAAREAESIIELQVEHFMAWWGALDGHGPLRAMREGAARQRDDVLARARVQLAHGRPPEQVLDFLAHTLTNTLLHAPTVGLRQAAERGDRETLRVAGRLFGDAAASTPADDDPAQS